MPTSGTLSSFMIMRAALMFSIFCTRSPGFLWGLMGGAEGRGRGEGQMGGAEGRGRTEEQMGGAEGRGRRKEQRGGAEGRGRGKGQKGGAEGRGRGKEQRGEAEGRGRGKGKRGEQVVSVLGTQQTLYTLSITRTQCLLLSHEEICTH